MVIFCVVANKVCLARSALPKRNSTHLNNTTFVSTSGVNVSRKNKQIKNPPEHNSKGMLEDGSLDGEIRNETEILSQNYWTEIQFKTLRSKP